MNCRIPLREKKRTKKILNWTIPVPLPQDLAILILKDIIKEEK